SLHTINLLRRQLRRVLAAGGAGLLALMMATLDAVLVHLRMQIRLRLFAGVTVRVGLASCLGLGLEILQLSLLISGEVCLRGSRLRLRRTLGCGLRAGRLIRRCGSRG